MLERLLKFLSPDKGKVALALVLPVVWFIVGIIFYSTSFGQPSEGKVVIPSIFPLIVSYLVMALYGYPFACSIIAILNTFSGEGLKGLRTDKTTLVLVILGIVLFNPISLSFLFFISFLILSSFQLYTPPEVSGISIVEVFPNSTMSSFDENHPLTGDILIEINDIPVERTEEALKILEKTKPRDEIQLETPSRDMFTHLGSHENLTRGYLGIRVRDVNGTEAIL